MADIIEAEVMSRLKFFVPVVILAAFMVSWHDPLGSTRGQDHCVQNCFMAEEKEFKARVEQYLQKIRQLEIQLEKQAREKCHKGQNTADSVHDDDNDYDSDFALMDEILELKHELEKCNEDSAHDSSLLKACQHDCDSYVTNSYQECQDTLSMVQGNLTDCRSDRARFQDKYLNCHSSLMTCQSDYLKKESMMNQYVEKCKSDIDECKSKLKD